MEAALGRMISSCPNYLHADVSDGEDLSRHQQEVTDGQLMSPPPLFLCVPMFQYPPRGIDIFIQSFLLTAVVPKMTHSSRNKERLVLWLSLPPFRSC